MTEKRFTIEIIEDKDVFIHQDGANHYLGVNGYVNGGMVVDLLNSLSEELYIAENEIARLELINDKLKKENEMLKITIGRNEAYINQLTNKEKWTN